AADAHGTVAVAEPARADPPLAAHPVEGERRGDRAGVDAGRPGASVGLEHVAVEDDRARPDRLEVHARAERAPDEALDLGRASVRALALLGATVALGSCAGVHVVLGREPAAAREPLRRVVDDRRVDEHGGPAGAIEDRARRVLHEAELDLDGPKRGLRASVDATHRSFLLLG